MVAARTARPRAGYIPERGDIVWLEFDPVRGHEQDGRRPAFVISPAAYNAKTGLLLACPITSHVKGYPFEVPVSAAPIAGVILADHIRSVDWRARRVQYVAGAPAAVCDEVEGMLRALIEG